MNKNNKIIQVEIPEADLKKFKEITLKKGLRPSTYLRMLLYDELNKQESSLCQN